MSLKPVNSVLLSALVASALSLIAAAAGASAPLSRSTEAVQQYLKAEMASRHIPGMQVAVVQHGRIAFLAAMGVADTDRNVPVTDSTMFAIASATKAFTGVALMQLVERHKLDLAAPVSRYLDGSPPAWRTVTIRQLAAGFAVFVPPEKVTDTIAAARSVGIRSWHAGVVEAGPRKVTVEPLQLEFQGDELQLRN